MKPLPLSWQRFFEIPRLPSEVIAIMDAADELERRIDSGEFEAEQKRLAQKPEGNFAEAAGQGNCNY